MNPITGTLLLLFGCLLFIAVLPTLIRAVLEVKLGYYERRLEQNKQHNEQLKRTIALQSIALDRIKEAKKMGAL